MPGCAVRNASAREPSRFQLNVAPGLVTKHTVFVNRKCYVNFLCVIIKSIVLL